MAVSMLLLSLSAQAEERSITFDRLPVQARTFINNHFLTSEVTQVIVDESVIRPEYTVFLAQGVNVEFDYNGSLEKVSSPQVPIPSDVIPAQIKDYVARHYPDASFVEYEVDHKHYEVKLSNNIELDFNRRFHLVEADR